MPAENLWWSYLPFHLGNYALALLFWTLIGRFMFGMFLRPDSPNYIYRWFCRLTDWFVRPVAFITPRVMPPVFIAPIAAFWLIMIRILFFAVMLATGQLPSIPGAGR